MAKVKDYVAKLTIEEFPKTSDSQRRLTDWLKEKIAEIESADPSNYAEPCNFRLMK